MIQTKQYLIILRRINLISAYLFLADSLLQMKQTLDYNKSKAGLSYYKFYIQIFELFIAKKMIANPTLIILVDAWEMYIHCTLYSLFVVFKSMNLMR